MAAEAKMLWLSLEGMVDLPRFDLAAALHLPPTILMSSCTDLTVPWCAGLPCDCWRQKMMMTMAFLSHCPTMGAGVLHDLTSGLLQ